MATRGGDNLRCVSYAVGVRKRLQEDARRAGWSVSIPRYALVGAVKALLGTGAVEATPPQHGRKPRVLCSACSKLRPATLHWSEACLGRQPAAVGMDTARESLCVLCRRCASRRGGATYTSAAGRHALHA